jgi:hypothetical protein
LKYFLNEIKKDNNEQISQEYNYSYPSGGALISKNINLPRGVTHLDTTHSKVENNLKSKLPLNDFSHFRSELTQLQCNIDKLERKLCNF